MIVFSVRLVIRKNLRNFYDITEATTKAIVHYSCWLVRYTPQKIKSSQSSCELALCSITFFACFNPTSTHLTAKGSKRLIKTTKLMYLLENESLLKNSLTVEEEEKHAHNCCTTNSQCLSNLQKCHFSFGIISKNIMQKWLGCLLCLEMTH